MPVHKVRQPNLLPTGRSARQGYAGLGQGGLPGGDSIRPALALCQWQRQCQRQRPFERGRSPTSVVRPFCRALLRGPAGFKLPASSLAPALRWALPVARA